MQVKLLIVVVAVGILGNRRDKKTMVCKKCGYKW
uniref:PhnA Zinc-Ribbon n=1 Tax=virus sp. ctmTa7 TaxID=2828255 RepID=A0A8S5RBS8_9VIRU|nr:MAG TPA: PhnA Zinc-Ribbon [virus sp. ctmTa7]